ncbi:hypothetical protein DSECCO2_517290 [anaerobic digester metagenome]
MTLSGPAAYLSAIVCRIAMIPGLPLLRDPGWKPPISMSVESYSSLFTRSVISSNIRRYAVQWGSTPRISPSVGVIAL